jgi:hypothetical protein
MPVRFSTRCPNSNHLGFEASPEAIVTAAKKAEEVGFDAIFGNDHIIVDGSPRAASWTNILGSVRCDVVHCSAHDGLVRAFGPRAAQGCRLSRSVGQTLSRGLPLGAVERIVTEKGLPSDRRRFALWRKAASKSRSPS